MADDKYNSQKHRFQYIERIRKQRRRRRACEHLTRLVMVDGEQTALSPLLELLPKVLS